MFGDSCHKLGWQGRAFWWMIFDQRMMGMSKQVSGEREFQEMERQVQKPWGRHVRDVDRGWGSQSRESKKENAGDKIRQMQEAEQAGLWWRGSLTFFLREKVSLLIYVLIVSFHPRWRPECLVPKHSKRNSSLVQKRRQYRGGYLVGEVCLHSFKF